MFTRKDFELQLDGLQRFDNELAKQKYPIRVFERPEFLAAVDELLELVPEPGEQEEKVEEEVPAPKKVTPKVPSKPKLSNGAAQVKSAVDKATRKREVEVEQEDPAPIRRLAAKVVEEELPQEIEEEVQVPQQESIADRIRHIKEKAGLK